jgi:hypothetical protein
VALVAGRVPGSCQTLRTKGLRHLGSKSSNTSCCQGPKVLTL